MSYRWFDSEFLDGYTEIDFAAAQYGVRGTGVQLEDEIRFQSAEGDKVIVGNRSPSRSFSEDVRFLGDESNIDDNFIDVEVNLPNP